MEIVRSKAVDDYRETLSLYIAGSLHIGTDSGCEFMYTVCTRSSQMKNPSMEEAPPFLEELLGDEKLVVFQDCEP